VYVVGNGWGRGYLLAGEYPLLGVLNMISKLPAEANRPDLGPKCYLAYDDTYTNLHYDMSDAVNLLVHVGSASRDKSLQTYVTFQGTQKTLNAFIEGDAALWHIFKRGDVPVLVEFLIQRLNLDSTILFDHSTYVDDSMLEELARIHNITPVTFVQRRGDAVFIPAGCPHQVRNLRCCIKVAEDFVSPENLRYCIELTDKFRELPMGHKFRTDKLQVRNILYHAVKSVVEMLE